MSALVRALIFFFANLTAGWRAALGAMAAEYCFRALTSGFCGAMTQYFSLVEPEWQAAMGAMLVLPVVSHSLEFLLHWLRHMPHLRVSVISSMCFTVFSTFFNFYGANAPSLLADMRRIPRTIAGFVCVVPLWTWRSLRCPGA